MKTIQAFVRLTALWVVGGFALLLSQSGACGAVTVSTADCIVARRGDLITVSGTIHNTGASAVYLNGDAITAALNGTGILLPAYDLFADDSPFAKCAPVTLAAGQRWIGPLFKLTIGIDCPLQTYSVTFSVEGGGNSALFNILGSGTVALTVNDDVPPISWIPTGALATGRYGNTATLLHNGKVLVAGGGNGVVFRSAEIYDPATGSWTPTTGSLATERAFHTATLLPDGKVLVVGGSNEAGSIDSAELYDPATGSWTDTGSIATARYRHTATLLPNGKVLVAGGYNDGQLDSAEIYDPASGSWTATGFLAAARYIHTATLLADGRVLVAGGQPNSSGLLASAEIYDPASGNWTPTGSLATARFFHTAMLLPDGRVLVAGGSKSAIAEILLADAEIYDPATGLWSATGSFAAARYYHLATLLPNGKVLVVGGFTGGTLAATSAELFDPASGCWVAVGSLPTGRGFSTATLLPSGRVLVAGGTDNDSVLASAELYDPAAGSSTPTGSLVAARSVNPATLLPDGKVLVVGGIGGVFGSAELYDPATGLWSATGALPPARFHHSATLLPSGKVLVVGGFNFPVSLDEAELYDPAAGLWSATGSLATGRHIHTATLLPNGQVLVAGGDEAYRHLASAELYDPASGTWTDTGSLADARNAQTGTLLPNGKVLVAGGTNDDGVVGSAELYDPATGVWNATAPLGTARYFHTATLLPTGKVLVVGGNDAAGSLASAELYDPATGLWSATGSLANARRAHSATLLPNGKVLVAGGLDEASGTLNSTELYDPATGTWSASASLAIAHVRHTATLLLNGRVLIAGGGGVGGVFAPIANAEIYDVGLGFSDAWRPQITSAAFDSNGRLMLTGTGFRGISGASGGNASHDSPTNYPVVQLRRLDNEQSVFLLSDPASSVSATSFTSGAVPAMGVGPVLVTVFANGIPSVARLIAQPAAIVVEQPMGSAIADGGIRDFGIATCNTPASLIFKIINAGSVNLTGLTITKDGANASDFNVTASPTAPVAPGGMTTFTVQLAPSRTTSGTASATIHIANNVPGNNPYNIRLTGQVLSYVTDSDGDRLSDASEFDMAALGYNWQDGSSAQIALVHTLFDNAEKAGLCTQTQYDANRAAGRNDVLNAPNPYGLYTLSQVQALNVGVPLIQKDQATGNFKLTIGVKKTTNLLLPFTDFPMNAPGTSTVINGAGKLEFQFSVPDNAAFFRIESQ